MESEIVRKKVVRENSSLFIMKITVAGFHGAHILRVMKNTGMCEMEQYVSTSLEMHLFFGRIMKEHALFLLASFPAGEMSYRRQANWYKVQFEEVLERAVRLAEGRVGEEVLESGEVVTEYTELAERQTSRLTGISIRMQITQAEHRLRAGTVERLNPGIVQQIQNLNRTILRLLNGLIEFKEELLSRVLNCSLYTANYPLLIEHILREARLYRKMLTALENGCVFDMESEEMETFWNQIMMEHAEFIRGLLDPTECKLITTADEFAADYCNLLQEAEKQECKVREEMSKKALELTERYRDFKAAGTKGITSCSVRSVILPLLADHVLREANHYLRLLEIMKNI